MKTEFNPLDYDSGRAAFEASAEAFWEEARDALTARLVKTPQEILGAMRETYEEAIIARENERIMKSLRMDSSDPTKPIHGGYQSMGATATAPLNPTYTSGSGIIGSTAGIGVSGGGGITINANVLNGSYTVSGGTSLKTVAPSTSPILPEIVLEAHDENGKRIEMELIPERTISAFECLQITMMLMAYCDSPDSFCPLAFVKKNNLERHFKFAS